MRANRILQRLMLSCLLTVAVFYLAGCGGAASDAPATAPVSGKVTLDGKPLAGAKVNFVNPTKSAVGLTDAEGKYSLPSGVIPGKNSVYISKIEGEGSVDDGMDAGQMMAADPAGATGEGASKIKDAVPEQFSDPTKSELSIDVPAGGTDEANFDLK